MRSKCEILRLRKIKKVMKILNESGLRREEEFRMQLLRRKRPYRKINVVDRGHGF